MTDDIQPVFQFDPLPGETGKPVVPTELEKPKKRGRPAKVKRQKRRKIKPRVAVKQEPAKVEIEKPPRKQRKHAAGRHTVDEYDFIGQLMLLSNARRKKIMAILNKVFG